MNSTLYVILFIIFIFVRTSNVNVVNKLILLYFQLQLLDLLNVYTWTNYNCHNHENIMEEIRVLS